MATVTAALVKELRNRTGAGMMDCKKALEATQGDIEQAIENMRKSGQAKAAKKAGRIAAEGIILSNVLADKAFILEVNCETDFVSRDENFRAFGHQVMDLVAQNQIEDLDKLKNTTMNDGESVEVALNHLIAKIGENMSLRRLEVLSGSTLGTYIHSNQRIGVVVALEGGDASLARDIGMHIAAFSPQYIHATQVPVDVLEKERQIQLEIAINSGKPSEIAEKMVSGRMRKFASEISLTGQNFVKEPEITVAQLLERHAGAQIKDFIRFEVGEGIERQSDDFAAEVQAQVAAAQAK